MKKIIGRTITDKTIEYYDEFEMIWDKIQTKTTNNLYEKEIKGDTLKFSN